jgi:hypothetical protein
MDFHVLPGLPCDVILGEEFLQDTDAFNTCTEIGTATNHYFHSLNLLITLGPLQSLITKLWGGKKRSRNSSQASNEDEYL